MTTCKVWQLQTSMFARTFNLGEREEEKMQKKTGDHLMAYLFPVRFASPLSLSECVCVCGFHVVHVCVETPRLGVLILPTCLCRFMAAFCCLTILLGSICTLWLFTDTDSVDNPQHSHARPLPPSQPIPMCCLLLLPNLALAPWLLAQGVGLPGALSLMTWLINYSCACFAGESPPPRISPATPPSPPLATMLAQRGIRRIRWDA